MSQRQKDWALVLGFAVILAVCMGLIITACESEPPSSPSSSSSPTPAATPTPQAVTPEPVTPSGNTWTHRGLKVEIIHDDWGGDGCHSNGGVRTFRLTNQSDVTKYSRLAAYTDDVPTCATSKYQTGKPKHWGCTEVKPGETCDYSIEVTFPKGTDGTCSLQVDDCWGPGGLQECSFVAGDGFKVPDSKCKKICVEDPEEIVKEGCDDWGECKVVSEGEWKGRFCVTYLSNSGSGYRIEDDGAIWKDNLTLSRGRQNTCWNRSNLDGSNLCLWWKNEKIDCARASCGDVEESWHGSVKFRCNQDPICEQERPCWKTTTIDYKCKPDVTSDEEWTEKRSCDCPE